MNQIINEQVSIEKVDRCAFLTIDYPPVNALSTAVRAGLLQGIEQLENDHQVQAIVIFCRGKTFIAGADIKEFGQPPQEPFLPDVVNRIAACRKPVIAALFGTSLGGGFEVALACHYRIALSDAKVGLPEVNLGLIPGAGGTQRLPKIVGVGKAIEMITSGKHYAVKALQDTGLFDAITEGDLEQACIDFVANLKSVEHKPLTEKAAMDTGFDWQRERQKVMAKARGASAPVVAFDVIEKTWMLPVSEGMKIEREAFLKLRDSVESKALRHVFAAERAAGKLPFDASPLQVEKVGVVGGGNMGSGIATALLNAGYQVTVIEHNAQAAEAAHKRIHSNIEGAVKRGKMSPDTATEQLTHLIVSADKQQLGDCDLVIEAVFEDLQVKKDLFAELNRICKADCLFASNTSYLDINAIADASGRALQFVGMHFFSPAHLMKLLEVVRGDASSEQAIATAMAVGKKLKKVAVLVGVCFGFAGNRMYTRYGREIQQMLLEGAAIEQVDKAMLAFGMAMGPLAVQDLSGIDIGHAARSTQPFPAHDPGYFRPSAIMVENGRLGRKTGKGFYRYDETGKAEVDEAAEQMIREEANRLKIAQKALDDDEIQRRAWLALVSEGVALLEEGIVQRASDIDVIWINGYGFPRHKGGPMFMAKQLGHNKIAEAMHRLQESYGDKIWPQRDWSLIDN